ncbi:dTMP kinase [Enterobacter cancerogenus]|uniref:dTMP kinase n=1 Tax=Enterobacter cancerogenus TaxID=69218 RepID=UPI0034D2AFBD
MRGKLISFEGIDGSGKGTQSKLLLDKLNSIGVTAKLFSFPCYEKTFFGKEIGAFLRGEFGGINDVHPKLASILYAMDRFEKRQEIVDLLSQGATVICDRYVDSNIAHQSSKLPVSEQKGFIDWISELEYNFNKMPVPDLTFFLNVPLNVSKEMVLKKKKRSYTDSDEDIHERAYGYLDSVLLAYNKIDFGTRWNLIECCNDNDLMEPEVISDIIYKITMKGL